MNTGARRLALFGLALLISSRAVGATAVPQWQQIFYPAADGTTSAAPIAARELADGTVLVVTQSFQTIHYNHDGTIVSFRQLELNPPEDRIMEAGPGGVINAHAAIDGFGRVALSFVAYLNYVPIDTGIVETVKFDGLTGEALWPAPVFYNPNLGQHPTNVFLDRNGDVIVTGVAPGNLRHFTVKYDGRDGATLWGPILIDNVSFPTVHTTASVDNLGSVYVSVPSIFPEAGLSTVKYSGTNGAIVWGPVVFPDPNAQPNASVVGPDGGYVVAAGSDDEFVVLKYNADSGALLWGPSHVPVPQSLSETVAESLVADAGSDLFLTGRYPDPGNGTKLLSRKLSGDTGGPLWTGVPFNVLPSFPPIRTAVAGNGDLVVGAVLGTTLDPRLNFWRYRGLDGSPLWGPSEFGGSGLYDPPAFFVGSNGRIFTSEIAASQSGGSAALSSGEIDGLTGIPAWGPTEASFPRIRNVRLVDLAAGPDADPVVTGNVVTGVVVTLKYDRASGNVLWGPIEFAPADTYVQVSEVAVDSANNVVVTGYSQELSGEVFGTFLVKYSGATGALLWGPIVLPDITPQRLALDSAGNVLVLAWKPDLIFGPTHTAVAKVSGATGAVVWGPVVFDSGSGNLDYGWTIAVDASGNALVTGDTTDINGEHWFVLKYSGVNGALLWGPSSGTGGRPYSAAVDGAGNLAVSGNNDLFNMATVKYSGSTGAILWGPREVSPGAGGAVAIAPNGDVVAAGSVVHPGTGGDLLTIRYEGSDGSVVWGPVFTDGEGHKDDTPYLRGLGFDLAGNVVLGGTSRSTQTNADVALVKYDGVTGATLWGPVYVGGPDNETLSGMHVAGESIAVGTTSAAGMLTAVLDETLGIQTATPNLPPAFCGQAYAFPVVAKNGTTPYTWTIVSGSLPDGLTLSVAGTISGTPTEQGTFAFRVRVQDSVLAAAERDFSLVVTEDPEDFAILAFPTGPCEWILAVAPGWASYLWFPNGETTSTIVVSPIETTTYGVAVGDGSGCLLHLSVTIPGIALQDPDCLAPSIDSISPTSGPSSGGTPVTILGAKFQPGAQLEIGGQPVSTTVVDPSQITSTTPALPPGTLANVLVGNPDTGNAILFGAFFFDFLDVPPANVFHDSVEKLLRSGVTVGCGSGLFCVDASTTRAQMAVFLLKSLLGPTYVPPPPTGGLFDDVFLDTFAAAWIEDLYNRGITGGCLTDPLRYCPDANVSRAEMAVFLLKTLLGNGYVPPAATGTVFADVSVDTFGAAWIEDLYNRGITAGCLTDPLRYCPDAPVSRGEMAAFLVLTFSL